jgi:hypothetical protein
MNVPPTLRPGSGQGSTGDWDPLPRSLEAIKEWYRKSQIEEAPYRTPREIPERVVHQISVSLTMGKPLARIHLKRLIEYADRFEDEAPRSESPRGGLDALPVPKDR